MRSKERLHALISAALFVSFILAGCGSDDNPISCRRNTAALNLTILVNGQDVDEPPGPYIFHTSPVEWTYIAVNTGDEKILDMVIYDEEEPGAVCRRDTLAPGDTAICYSSGQAVMNALFTNIAVVLGESSRGFTVSAVDTSY